MHTNNWCWCPRRCLYSCTWVLKMCRLRRTGSPGAQNVCISARNTHPWKQPWKSRRLCWRCDDFYNTWNKRNGKSRNFALCSWPGPQKSSGGEPVEQIVSSMHQWRIMMREVEQYTSGNAQGIFFILMISLLCGAIDNRSWVWYSLGRTAERFCAWEWSSESRVTVLLATELRRYLHWIQPHQLVEQRSSKP